MKYIFSSILVKTLFVGLSIFPLQGFANINHSPVVQIMSYKTSFDRNTELLWWGSASIINDKWVIITNNHVVDDGKWNALEIFSICFSQIDGEKTKCPYTASLIDRDETMDIAILKIDSTDINGQKVDYTKLQKIDIAYEYEAKTGNEVEAVGYPGVGSNTITRTKWIISWTSKFNDLTYIKTDTLIAGGNSWGALISDGKLVWIPTYTKWGFFDPSLGYALYIKEAQIFIEKNIDKTPISISLSNFSNYKKNIDKINETKKVSDKFLTLSFPKEYELINYIENKKVTFAPTSDTENIPQNIEIFLQDIPSVKTTEEFLYYMETLGLYSKSYQKLKKLSISWIDFYEPVSIYDSSDGTSTTYKILFWKYGDSVITIAWDLWYVSENNLSSVQKKFDDFIKNISFNTSIKDIAHTFEISNPKIKFFYNPKYIYDDVMWFFTLYLNGNLHEYIEMSLWLMDVYSGKWQDVETIYEQETRDINSDFKSLASFNGHPGFIYCGEDNPYGYLSYDEKWNSLSQSYCKLRFYDFQSQNESYYLDINIVTDKKNIKSGLETVVKNLPKLISIPSIWDGETKLNNIYTSQIKLNFKDINWQKQWYKAKLKTLIKYNLIKNEASFSWETPLKWGEFLDLYFRSVYALEFDTICSESDYKCKFWNFNIAVGDTGKKLSDVFSEMWINLDYYVNKEKLYYLQDYFDLVFSWVDTKKIDGEFMFHYSQLKNEQEYAEIKNTIDELNYQLYGIKKITFSDIYPSYSGSSYIAKKVLYFVKEKGIVEQKLFTQWKMNFSQWMDIVFPTNTYYSILLRWEAIDFIIDRTDLWLFDSELAKKKNTNIE